MKSNTPQERIEWLVESYDVTPRCANALLLFEVGFSTSGVAKRLEVTEGTARKYKRELEAKIGERVTETVTSNKPRYPVFPGDTPKSDVEYSGDYGQPDTNLPRNEGSINYEALGKVIG